MGELSSIPRTPAGENQSRPVRHDVRVLSSRDLFRADNEIQIQHDNQLYRLRITRQGKLILTK